MPIVAAIVVSLVAMAMMPMTFMPVLTVSMIGMASVVVDALVVPVAVGVVGVQFSRVSVCSHGNRVRGRRERRRATINRTTLTPMIRPDAENCDQPVQSLRTQHGDSMGLARTLEPNRNSMKRPPLPRRSCPTKFSQDRCAAIRCSLAPNRRTGFPFQRPCQAVDRPVDLIRRQRPIRRPESDAEGQ